ncbi:MAG TPA: substrate import-associated zinc metallohydrolase lipoprotein [Flavobacterium sp.]|jgi:substrate import-associated zinc metallohydrolase lipoprotein
MIIAMKLYKKILIVMAVVSLMACSKEEPLTESQLTTPPQMNESDTDRWINTNFINPYNVRVLYKWNQNTVDNNRFLFPPTEEKVLPAMEVVQKLWIDSYNTAAGESNFIRNIAPREFVLVGGVNLNTTGTVTLGIAEGGMRITLFEVDLLRRNNRDDVVRFIHTLQHEYAHILTQTRAFDEQAFSTITPSGYTANWYELTNEQARERGFITAYAQDKVFEDFAEMVASMLDYSRTGYDALINGITNVEARAALRAKEAQVVRYYRDNYNIDFYVLQNAVEQNRLYILNL